MAFALKTAASRALPLTKGQSRRQVLVSYMVTSPVRLLNRTIN